MYYDAALPIPTLHHEIDGSIMHDVNDAESLNRLIPLVYDELRAIAHRQLAKGRLAGAEASLETTALVHEVYLKLVGGLPPNDAGNQAHFLALVTIAMRHILIDRAKARVRQKRGGTARAVTLNDEIVGTDAPERLLEIDDAIRDLAVLDSRLARVVELRFFGGMSEPEIAEVLGVTVRTVERDWTKARAVLRRALEP
jgi:RNA polymerase sigma factor (TIGR02999 family)